MLLGKCQGKGTLGRPRHRVQDYIKIDIQETWRGWRVCPGFVGLRIRVSVGGRGGSCEHGSENLGYKKNVGIS